MRGRSHRGSKGNGLRSHHHCRPRQRRQRHQSRRHSQHRSLAQSRALHLHHRQAERHRRERRPCRRRPQHPAHHGPGATEGNDRQVPHQGLAYKNNGLHRLNGFKLGGAPTSDAPLIIYNMV